MTLKEFNRKRRLAQMECKHDWWERKLARITQDGIYSRTCCRCGLNQHSVIAWDRILKRSRSEANRASKLGQAQGVGR